ncbi:nucleotide-binding universal stress UspA family protein [Catalinimonas alkaloidigena]|uniref:universal stress protein n=1 Tax=Catalinimonas alkaloidigena TaxID=1075417 RepID=UPI0024064EF2|nr:universal stress protein [Catalinimonas alkaloidigena]MDF9796546.1 nucleotide-binding universal stress UspA family protein [Catalinimonas alkaloidigena]
MKILTPIDFSADAFEALRYAVKLAHQWKAGRDESPELIVFHAFHLPIGGDATFFIDNAMLEREEVHVQNKIQHMISKIPEIQSLHFRLITKMALPNDGIRQIVKEKDIQLVVMGKHGIDESLSNWLGSTTLEMMKHLPCPVLAIPQATIKPMPHLVAFATDLKQSDEDHPSLLFFKELLKLWKAELKVIHVHPQPSKIGIAHAEEALSLEHFFHDVPHTYEFPEDQDPAQGLNHYLQEHEVDLLAIIPRKHSGLESIFHKSVSKYLASQTSVPLISLHHSK